MLTSPLHERHVAAGARFAAFSGWSMPLEYAGAGVLAEHTAARRAEQLEGYVLELAGERTRHALGRDRAAAG